MDLLQKNVKGTLDAMAACKLLWAGALVFNRDDAEQESGSTTALTPTINDGVISLYSVSHEEVEAVVPDLLRLLSALEADDELHVDPAMVSPAVLEAFPTGQLTGATLFLLQSGDHPLIVEPAKKDCVRVRYDNKLARGIPHLQDLLCRMICHLRYYNGERGPCTVLFAANDNRGNPCGIADFEGCVRGAVELLDQSVEVDNCLEVEAFYVHSPAPDKANNATTTSRESTPLGNATSAPKQSPDIDLLRIANTLETNAYILHALADQTNRRIAEYEETLERVDQAQPSAKTYKTSTSMPKDLLTNARASQSLALRSAVYIGIGVALLALGSACVKQNEDVSAWIVRMVDGAFVRAYDFIGLVLGQFGQVGTHVALGLPADSLAGLIRIAGYVLMAVGIIFPVRKILKHNRRLKRELALHKSHVDYMSALVAKKHMNDEIAYAQDLETWSAKLQSLETSISFAKRSRSKLEHASTKTADALARHYASTRRLPKSVQNLPAASTLFDYINTGRCSQLEGPNGALEQYRDDLRAARIDMDPSQATTLQPTLRTAVRSCDSLLRELEAQPSEEKRCLLVAEQCDKVITTLAIARGTD